MKFGSVIKAKTARSHTHTSCAVSTVGKTKNAEMMTKLLANIILH